MLRGSKKWRKNTEHRPYAGAGTGANVPNGSKVLSGKNGKGGIYIRREKDAENPRSIQIKTKKRRKKIKKKGGERKGVSVE